MEIRIVRKAFQIVAGALLFPLLSHPTHAGTYNSGDWTWSTDDPETYWAISSNEANNVIGQFCYLGQNSCVYFVNLNTDCEQGAKYPAMLNSEKGSASVMLTCSHKTADQAHWVFIIHPFDDVDNFVRTSVNLGIAVPMASGQFKVSRFSLRGSVNAIDPMREAAARRKSGEGDQSVRKADEQFL